MDHNSSRDPVMSLTKIIVYIVYVIAVCIEVILLLRVALLLFGANPNVPFVQWIYTTSSKFMAPFTGIFPPQAAGVTSGYLDTSALFAALIYLIIVSVIQTLLYTLDRRR